MNVKTLVSKCLNAQGIVANKSVLGLNFSFQDWNFLFRLTLPGIYDVTDANFARAIMACNNINWNYKVVKAVLYEYEDGKEKGASVWMCYEQQIDAAVEMEALVNRALQSLLSACDAFSREMNDE